MELLDAIETASLTKIKEIIQTKDISLDNSLSSRALMRAFAYERKDVVRFLLKDYCRVNVQLKTYSFTTTPLHCAVKLRDVSLIKEILQKNLSIVADSDGNTALHLAFLHKHEEATDLILKHIEKTSKYINSKNRFGLTHMHIACTRKNTDVIRGFLDTEINLNDAVDVNSPSWAGYTAMHFASDFRSLEAFRLLDDEQLGNDCVKSKDSNTKTVQLSPSQIVNKHLEDLLVMSYFSEDQNEGREVYFFLACSEKDPSLLKKFIHNGANVNCTPYNPLFNWTNNTALHIAVEKNRKDAVELLLQKDAHVKAKNKLSMTALHLALYKEYFPRKDSIVDLLYNKTVNKDTVSNIEDENGLGYFHVAITRNDFEMVKKYLDEGLDINKLIKPNKKKYSHYTPLHFAILYNHKEMAKLLIKHGVNVDLTGEENKYGTPLHMAFEFGREDLIELLLSSGADSSIVRPFDGRTILHSLVSKASSTFLFEREKKENVLSTDKEAILMYVEQLVKLGNQVNTQDENGYTVLHLLKLANGKCGACLQLLLDLGADINVEDSDGDLPFDIISYIEGYCVTDEYLIFYHHIQKLKAMRMNVHPKNDEFCKKIEEDWKKLETSKKALMDNELACRQQQRVDEVARLKNIMITSFTSLYNFLRLEPKRAATYMPNNILKNILEDQDFGKKFPSYGYLIRLQYERNTNDFQAQHSGKRTLCSETGEESQPPKRQRFE